MLGWEAHHAGHLDLVPNIDHTIDVRKVLGLALERHFAFALVSALPTIVGVISKYEAVSVMLMGSFRTVILEELPSTR